jgi:1-deoxy-D-xylulose-5-phosphate synthase
MHTVSPPVPPDGPAWTAVLGDELVAIGRERPDVVALTAAMLHPTGLAGFAAAFPERVFDVGIAEQHAVTSAAGMAFAGLHPVVALYATFLNRAFDQVLMDVALHRAGVTFVLDRAGITGPDGPSHHGMWDLAMLRLVPGLRLAAPRDEATLREALRTAVDVDDAPTVVRYPKGSLGPDLPAADRLDDVDIVARTGPRSEAGDAPRVLLVGVGAMVGTALEAARVLGEHGVRTTVAAPTWVLPMPSALVKLAGEADLVVTVEDGLAEGGVGALHGERLTAEGHPARMLTLGLPTTFVDHASREEIVAAYRLGPADVAADALAALGRTRA